MRVADETPQLIEAYLLIEQPRQRIGHWTSALAALDSPAAPPLAAIKAYYDPIADQAVLELKYDELALGDSRLGFVVEVALLAEVGMVQPGELSDGERARFLGERLARCTLQISYARGVVAALSELVRRIKEQRGPRSQPPPIPQLAKGTRDDLQYASADALRAGTAASATVISKHVIPRATLTGLPAVTATSSVHAEGSPPPLPPPQPPPPPAVRASDELVPPTFQGVGASPYLPATSAAVRDMIHARYLRGGRWVPIRIGALSLKGAALMTGALPRLHDHVDVALSFGSHRALVRGAVGKVSTMREAAATGAAGFSIDFELDSASRRQLTELLTAARAANVTIKPPPPRATRRFPVEWPVCIGTPRGAIKADALDVSAGGMFVRPALPLQRESVVSFSAVLDDEGGPVGGRARVVRHINETLAKSCGIPEGYGLGIVDMAEAERLRWLAFLARIERRADKRVLVGASATRLSELQSGLEACGYVVTGGTDPGAIVQLARGERPVDVALFDAGWLSDGAAASWVENLFTARNVPFVTMQGDARRARMAIDRMLEVVV